MGRGLSSVTRLRRTIHVKLSETRKLAKLAVVIHDRLSTTSKSSVGWDLPELTWLQVRRELRRVRLAEHREWRHAQGALQSDLGSTVERLGREIQQLLIQLQPTASASPCSAHEIYRDLRALHEEFDVVAFSGKQNTLSVTTTPITLEERYLGPFRIELDVRTLQPQPFYTVVAEDPQPSSLNSEITHPHVQGDQLCEGEGTLPIRAALGDGRILDFFLIINNLLHTYNSSSPYVALEKWDGASCTDCDYVIPEDDARHCDRCEATLCSDCARCCCDCSESHCTSCSLTCAGCDDDLCWGCAQACCDCDQSFCPSCLKHNERCRACHATFQEEKNKRSKTDLQPVFVGQTAVLAGSG
jgi:hypothetical protein